MMWIRYRWLGSLLAGVMLLATAPLGVIQHANADTGDATTTTESVKLPYASLTLLSHEDGGGFGTSAAPYVSPANGYPQGDSGAQDGVVTSGDTVRYTFRLDAQVAGARTITIAMQGLPLDDMTYDCPIGRYLQRQDNTSGTAGCVYHVPAGTADTLTVTLTGKAPDTGGTTKTYQPTIGIWNGTNASTQPGASLRLGKLKVTSIPSMDVTLSSGYTADGKNITASGCPADSGAGCTGKTGSAHIYLKSKLTHPKSTTDTRGLSRTAQYTPTIDVSTLPDDTTYTLDGKTTLTPVTGMLRLPTLTGDHEITSSGLPAPDVGTQKHYRIHLTVTSPLSGWKGQPGDGLDGTVGTADSQTGAGNGDVYPNDDWTDVITVGSLTGGNDGDFTQMSVPYSAGEGLSDTGNMTAVGSFSDSGYTPASDGAATVAPGTIARLWLGTTATMPDECSTVVCVDTYSWHDGIQLTDTPMESHSQTVRILYSTREQDKISRVTGWKTSETDLTADGFTTTPPADLSQVKRIAIQRRPGDNLTLTWHVKATAVGWNAINVVTAPTGQSRTFVLAAKNPTQGTATANGLVTDDTTGKTSGEGVDGTLEVNRNDELQGMFTVTVAGMPSYKVPPTVDMTVCLPNGVTDVTMDADSVYGHKPITVTQATVDGCANAYAVTIPSDSAYMSGIRPTDFTMGTVRWHGRVSPTMNDKTMTVTMTGTVSLPAYGESVEAANIPVGVSVSLHCADTQSSVLEIPRSMRPAYAGTEFDTDTLGKMGACDDDTLSCHQRETVVATPGQSASYQWTVNGADTTTMLALPSAGDGSLVDSTWTDYGHGSSTLTMTFAGQPTVHDGTLTGTATLTYTTDKITGFDPSGYTWKPWDGISDKTTITGVRVTLSGTGAGAVIDITATPSANYEGRAVMWAGNPYDVDGKPLTASRSWGVAVEYRYARLYATVYDDVNANTTYDTNEPTGREATVALWGVQDAQDTTQGTLKGRMAVSKRVKFNGTLTGGCYRIAVAIGDDTTLPGVGDVTVLKSTKTYYGGGTTTVTPVAPDTPYGHTLEQSTDTGGVFCIQSGATEDVRFGWRDTNPRLTVTQNHTVDSCTDTACKGTVTVTVANTGNTTLKTDSTVIHSKDSLSAASTDKWLYDDTSIIQAEWDGYLDSHHRAWLRDVHNNGGVRTAIVPSVSDYKPVQVSGSGDADMIAGVTGDGRIVVCKTGGVTHTNADWQPDDNSYNSDDPGMYLDTNCRNYGQQDASGVYHAFSSKDGTVTGDVNRANVITGAGRFTHVSIVGSEGDVVMTDADNNTWYWNMSQVKGDEPVTYAMNPVRINPQGVTFVGTVQANMNNGNEAFEFMGSDGNIYRYPCDYSATNATAVIATKAGTTTVEYPHLTLPDGVSIAGVERHGMSWLVLDSTHRLWLYYRHDSTGSGGTDFTAWERLDVKGVKSLPNLAMRANNALGGGKLAIWYVGEDNRLYRYDLTFPDQWGGSTDMSNVWGDADGEDSAHWNTSKPVMDDAVIGVSAVGVSTLEAVTTDGRLIRWGASSGATDTTPVDHSLNGYAKTMHATATGVATGDDGTTGDYYLPFDLQPGSDITLSRTFTIPRKSVRQVQSVQSWVDATDAPYSGITVYANDGPATRHADKPTAPDVSQLTDTTTIAQSLTGNQSCLMSGHGFAFEYSDHGQEDSCEQTGMVIPSTSVTVVVGSVSGKAWQDVDRNGVQDAGEPTLSGTTVTLRDADGSQVAQAKTDTDGKYSFHGLAARSYVAWFNQPAVTSDGANSEATGAWTLKHATSDTNKDSDVNPSGDEYGATDTLTVSAARADYTDVDAGLRKADSTPTLPATGLLGIVCAVVGLMLVYAAGWAYSRRRVPRHAAR